MAQPGLFQTGKPVLGLRFVEQQQVAANNFEIKGLQRQRHAHVK